MSVSRRPRKRKPQIKARQRKDRFYQSLLNEMTTVTPLGRPNFVRLGAVTRLVHARLGRSAIVLETGWDPWFYQWAAAGESVNCPALDQLLETYDEQAEYIVLALIDCSILAVPFNYDSAEQIRVFIGFGGTAEKSAQQLVESHRKRRKSTLKRWARTMPENPYVPRDRLIMGRNLIWAGDDSDAGDVSPLIDQLSALLPA